MSNLLSLFDGKSSGYTACELAGIPVDNYYSAEIDKYAIQVSNAIHPTQTRLGSVTEWREWNIDWASIDLILGGFPCQAWSMAGKQLGDKDERGILFWTMLDIMKHVRHYNQKAHFLIENVKMKKEFEEYITHHMTNAVGEVYKTLINSALVSAQNRKRYYWTSFTVSQPEDKGVVLADILEDMEPKVGRMVGRKINPETGKRDDYNPNLKTEQRVEPRPDDKSGCLTTVQKDNVVIMQRARGNNPGGARAIDGKSPTLSANSWQHNNHLAFSVNGNDRVKAISENEHGYRPHKNDASKSGISELGRILKLGGGKTDILTTSHAPKLAVSSDIRDLKYRKLTPRECFRLQTVPEHYIDKILACGVSNSQLYKIAGNGWTDEVIAHILRHIP
jgi:DNA-cytosine methyltransferase